MTSLMLMMIGGVSAFPQGYGIFQPHSETGTVEWTTAQAHSGSYSAYLMAWYPSTPTDSNEVYIHSFSEITTLNDLDSMSFWYYRPDASDEIPPQIDIWLDTDGTYDMEAVSGDDNWLLGQIPLATTNNEWVEVPLSEITWIKAVGGSPVYGTGSAGLAAAKAETNSGIYATLGNAPVVAIGVQAGSPATRDDLRTMEQKYYIDDIELNGVVYDFEPPTEVWVDDDDVTCGGNSPCYAIIQEGIDAVAAGGTVNVAAGTYTESLAINKGVTLQGAGRDVVTVTGAHTITANDVVIDGFEFQGAGSNVITIDDTIARSGGTISNNRITGGYLGIRVGTGSSEGQGVRFITIEGNIITANTNKGIRFYSGVDYEIQGIGDITISGNEITNNGDSGISTYGDGPNTITSNIVTGNAGNGISIKYDDGDVISGNIVTGNDAMGINMHQVTNTIVEYNTVSGHVSDEVVTTFWGENVTAGKGSAIYVHEASENNIIRFNDLIGNKIGVLINRESAGSDPSSNSINYNNILDNEVFGIQNAVPVTVDAEYNWWGTADESLIAAMVSDNVDYDPWLWKSSAGSNVVGEGLDFIALTVPDSINYGALFSTPGFETIAQAITLTNVGSLGISVTPVWESGALVFKRIKFSDDSDGTYGMIQDGVGAESVYSTIIDAVLISNDPLEFGSAATIWTKIKIALGDTLAALKGPQTGTIYFQATETV